VCEDPKKMDTKAMLTMPWLVAFVAVPRVRRRPHWQYRVVRTVDPVHRSPFGLWVLSRHEDVVTALRSPHMGNNEDEADMSVLTPGLLKPLVKRQSQARVEGRFIEVIDQTMLFRDPPDHTRLRALVSKTFTPRRIERLSNRVQELVDELLEPPGRRGYIELMREFAYPLPARVICELLGVPKEDEPFIVSHAPALGTGLDPAPMRTPASVAAANAATDALTEYLGGLIAERKRSPRDDMISALIAAEEAGDSLSHEELVSTFLLLLIAGHETTANLIGNGVLALLRHPDQLARLRADEDLDRSAVEELMRFDGPIQMVERITLEPVVVGGREIPARRILVCLTAAANRDPAAFPDPGRLDLGRTPNPHVGFGGGAHFCLGAALARLEGRIAIGSLVRRFPGLRLLEPKPAWRPSFTIRGLKALPLAL
jgi:pimeloyl-[acyl-carrier protein] synthase